MSQRLQLFDIRFQPHVLCTEISPDFLNLNETPQACCAREEDLAQKAVDEGCYQWRHYQVLRVIAKAIRTRVFFQQCCFYQGWGEDATRHKPYRGFWEQHRTDSLRSTLGHHSKATPGLTWF